MTVSDDPKNSLGDAATFAGRAMVARPSSDASLGDKRTIDDTTIGQDTVLDEIEVVDLESRYKIEGTLGQGGMGSVLLATDTRLDRKVAIKRILDEAARNQTAVNRFLTEAKSIASLNHPNIVQIYDYGSANDGPFLTMEYVDGGSLRDLCKSGPLPLDRVIAIACQLCDGLAKAHDQGIVHRDIKPANVLLTKDGIPKLADFGLAKDRTGDHGQTTTGAVLGTPDFMPPEQHEGARFVDQRSDLWALAATVYQMVTGRSPRSIRFKDVPESLQDVLGKALEEKKEDRYQSARELRDALKTSLRSAQSATVAVGLGHDNCTACGILNESDRKFCRGCGASLEAPCLSCSRLMQISDEICGYCGTKQKPAVESRLAAIAAQQAKADGLLGDLDFDKAIEVASCLREMSHPRLGQLGPWVDQFLGQVEASRRQQMACALDALATAAKHESEHDRISAAFALESVPRSLRGVMLPGARESVAAALSRLNAAEAEVRRLKSLVKNRVASKAIDGLLPEVERLLTLQPDISSMQRLRDQLYARRLKQEEVRDDALVKAQSLLKSADYEDAMAILSGVPRAVVTTEVTNLLEHVTSVAARVRDLAGAIREADKAKRFKGLVATVDEYLKLKPSDAEFLALRQSLVDREDSIEREVVARLERARVFERACRFHEAAKELAEIPPDRRDAQSQRSRHLPVESADKFLLHCEKGAALRFAAVNSLAAATAGGYWEAVAGTAGYRAFLNSANLADQEFAAALGQAEAALSNEQARTKLLRASGIAVGVLVLLVASGLWIRMQMRSAALVAALRNSRWDEAINLDGSNAPAYLGRAKEKLAKDPPDVDGAFADIESAAKTLGNSREVQTARGIAHATKSRLHALAGLVIEATKNLEEAVALRAEPHTLDAAKEAVALAWIAFAEKASREGDGAAVESAVECATKYGASKSQTAQLQASGLVLRAAGMWEQGDMKQAIALVENAINCDAGTSASMLDSMGSAELRSGLVCHYRKQFDTAVELLDIEQVVEIGAMAARLDSEAARWVETSLTPERLARVSPETFAALPVGVISTLPETTIAALPLTTIAALPPEKGAALAPAAIASLPPIQNSIGMIFKLIPAGTSRRGKVTIAKPFYICVYEVTNTQWKQVMGRVPNWRGADDQPAESSWQESVEFCRKLSALPAERIAGRVYRMPTMSEWESACRAGTWTDFSFGKIGAELGDYGWYKYNSEGHSHPVGQKKANAFGLFDMHGNLREWCSPDTAEGEERYSRGGGYCDDADKCEVERGFSEAREESYARGMRIAISATVADPPESGK